VKSINSELARLLGAEIHTSPPPYSQCAGVSNGESGAEEPPASLTSALQGSGEAEELNQVLVAGIRA